MRKKVIKGLEKRETPTQTEKRLLTPRKRKSASAQARKSYARHQGRGGGGGYRPTDRPTQSQPKQASLEQGGESIVWLNKERNKDLRVRSGFNWWDGQGGAEELIEA
mgnify:CR=1 FL=1